MNAKSWNVQVHISEEGDITRARAVLTTDGPEPLQVTGEARRNPGDRNVPEIGDELATARALSELAHRLLELTVADIETAQHEHAVSLTV